jgi:hypothetical protein
MEVLSAPTRYYTNLMRRSAVFQHSGMTGTPRASLIIAAPALTGNPVTLLLPPGVSKSFLLSVCHTSANMGGESHSLRTDHPGGALAITLSVTVLRLLGLHHTGRSGVTTTCCRRMTVWGKTARHQCSPARLSYS